MGSAPDPGLERPRRRRLALRLGLSLAATLAGLLVWEALWRLDVYGLDGFAVARMNSVKPIGRRGIVRASPHPEVGYELKPNLDLLFKMRPFQTSPAGLRDEPYPEAKPPGTYRIAVLGDSFTMGSGVALEDTYHSRLERLLAEGSEGTRYECLNFGVAGYGLMNYVGTLRHRALRYAPDLILVGLTANDRSAQRARALDDFGDAVEEEGLGFFFRFHCLDDAWRRLTGGGEPVSGEGAGRRQRGGRRSEKCHSGHQRNKMTEGATIGLGGRWQCWVRLLLCE